MPCPASGRLASRRTTVVSVALPAAAVGIGALALYLSQPHRGLFENGPELMEMWRRGIVVHGHALLLPLARLAASLGLTGSSPVPDRAVILVSSVAAALAVCVVTARAARWSGARAALAAGALLALSPVLRFYAGAVETRALGCGCAALAGALAGWAAPSRARALAATVGGYALALAAHASLVVLGPALLLLHADAEVRAGRRPTAGRLAGAGALLVLGALATAAAIYAADQRLNPALRSMSSWVTFYVGVSAGWAEHLGRPHPLSWTLSELLGPSNVLVPLALVGIGPLLRRAPWRAAALLLWTLLLSVASYGVGSRQFGGYFLGALPALAWLAAEGVRHVLDLPTRAAALRAAALAAVALLAVPAAIDAWHAGGCLVVGDDGYRPWVVQRGDLALPWPAPVGAALASLPPLVWLLIGALAALLAGRTRGTAAPARPPAALAAPGTAPALSVVGLALVLQLVGGESFRARWPILWSQSTRDYCEAARAALGPRDRLFTAVPHPGLAWQFNYYLGDRWTNVGMEALLAPAQRPDWLAGIEAEVERVRAGGGQAYLGQDGLALLELRRDESPRALAAAHRWLDEGRVTLWSPR